jgi:hypothetical protein
MSTLVISDVSYTPPDPNSVLLTANNYNEHHTLSREKYHTTLGDISSEQIINLLPYITNIKFIPDQFDINSNIYKETVVLLNYLSHLCKVDGVDVVAAKNFINQQEIFNRPNEPVLWVFGCSHSFGVGLKDGELPYGKLISQQLGMPLKLIAQPGSSTSWSFRHMINAKLQPNDIVIWQLTIPNRITRFEPESADGVETQLANTKDRYLLEVFNNQQIFFQHINILNVGVQYLRTKQIKFMLTSLMTLTDLFYEYLIEYTKYPEYCYAPNFNIDLGTDQCHVGPVSHKKLAQFLLTHLQYKL